MSMSKVVLAGLLLASVSVHAEETRSFKCGDYTVMTKWAKEGRFRKMTVLKGDDVVAMEDSTEPVMNNGIGNVITVQNSEVDLKNVSYLFIEQTTKGSLLLMVWINGRININCPSSIGTWMLR